MRRKPKIGFALGAGSARGWAHIGVLRALINPAATNAEILRLFEQALADLRKAGDFMASYREPRTRLPAPSYDLWEERRGILSFTCAAVYAGLRAAAAFARCFGEPANAFTRPITLNGGMIQNLNSAAIIDAPLTLASNSASTLTGANNTTFRGGVSGLCTRHSERQRNDGPAGDRHQAVRVAR